MRRKNRVSQLVAAAIVTLCSSPTMLAQQPDVVFDPRDFSGDWDRITSISVFSNVPGATAYGNSVIAVGDPDLTADPSTQEAPFTAEGKVRYDANMPGYGPRSEFRRNDPLGRCEPMGLVRNLNVEIIPPHLTFEIVQTPGRIFQFFEYRHDWREIWMDGRALPDLDDVFLKWNGHSVGHMEGDTLVVESVGFDDRSWVDKFGYPHSEELYLEERYRRVDADTLELVMTITDPAMYSEPWVSDRKLFQLNREKANQWDEQIYCVPAEEFSYQQVIGTGNVLE